MRLPLSITSLFILLASPVHAQWTWLYPKPQGHNLYDVEFLSDNVAIAVGEVGAVMVTHDAGVSWSISAKTEGITGALRHVAAVDANTAVVVGDAGIVLRTTNAGTTWTSQPSGTAATLHSVDFVGMLGVASGDGGIIRSTNGGQTWSIVQSGFPVYAVDVVTPSVAVAMAGPGFMRSVNGGLSWAFPPGSPFIPAETIAFYDDMHGVTIYRSTAYYTSDGGQTWSNQLGPPFNDHFGVVSREIVYVDSQTLFAAAGGGGCDGLGNCASSGSFFRSTNGGTSWFETYDNSPLHGIDRNSTGTVLLVGDGGSIRRWIAPSTWEQCGGSQYEAYQDNGALSFVDPSTGIMTGGRPPFQGTSSTTFLRTSDGGTTWSGAGLYGSYIADIAHTRGPTPTAYAVGRTQINGIFYSAVFKSSNGGATWPLLWNQTPYTALNALDFSTASHGVVVGDGGVFAVLDNDVVTTGTIAGGGSLRGVAFADAAVAVAVGSGGVFRSDNGGASWGNVPAPAGPRQGIAFASPTVGVAVGSGGGIMRTSDGGLTWQSIASPVTSFLVAVSFANANYGMIAGAQGMLLETVDGGLSWTALAAPTTYSFTDIACFGPRHAYVVSWGLNLLEFRDNTVPTLFSSFDARPSAFAAELRWAVQNDADLQGFRVLRREGAAIASVVATLGADARVFRDDSVRPGATYEYVLIAADQLGDETQSPAVRVSIPLASVQLLPNYPNPFNPATTISFVVPERMPVQLTVHDVAGRVVVTLTDDVRDAGVHHFTWNAEGIASGIYFAKLQAGKTELSRKMVLLK